MDGISPITAFLYGSTGLWFAPALLFNIAQALRLIARRRALTALAQKRAHAIELIRRAQATIEARNAPKEAGL